MNEFKNKETIDMVFTPENVTGIVEILNYLTPREVTRIKPTEFETIVAAAKADAISNLIQNVMQFSLNNYGK